MEFLLGLVVAWIAFFTAELLDRMIFYGDGDDEGQPSAQADETVHNTNSKRVNDGDS